jgi:hypothetical protein
MPGSTTINGRRIAETPRLRRGTVAGAAGRLPDGDQSDLPQFAAGCRDDETVNAGHGEKQSRKQEQAVAALLEESTVAAAAKRVKVSERALRTWMRQDGFRSAYRRARREVVEGAIGRLQGAAGLAVDTLLAIARDGAKECDRVRAAVALLDHALRGCAELPEAEPERGEGKLHSVEGTGGIVKVLAERLARIEAAELPTPEKTRLTATVADALLRAIGVDVIDKRLEALQAVLVSRKDRGE